MACSTINKIYNGRNDINIAKSKYTRLNYTVYNILK